MRILAWVLLFSLAFWTALSAQTLEDAQKAAKAMGFTGELQFHSTTPSGSTVYSGEGLALEYGGAMAGTLVLRTRPDSELNRDRKRVWSAKGAVARTKAFVSKVSGPLGITPVGDMVQVDVQERSGHNYSGWEVSVYTIDNGHKSYPMYNAKVDRSGAVVGLMYLPLANTVAKEPTLTQDEARDALLKSRGLSGSATYSYSELKVVPDQKGGNALAWVLELEPTASEVTGLVGAVDATTGEVLFSGENGYRPPAPAAPTPGQPTTQPAAAPPATDTASPPVAAYTLAALAVLLVVFLVVKLRKR